MQKIPFFFIIFTNFVLFCVRQAEGGRFNGRSGMKMEDWSAFARNLELADPGKIAENCNFPGGTPYLYCITLSKS